SAGAAGARGGPASDRRRDSRRRGPSRGGGGRLAFFGPPRGGATGGRLFAAAPFFPRNPTPPAARLYGGSPVDAIWAVCSLTYRVRPVPTLSSPALRASSCQFAGSGRFPSGGQVARRWRCAAQGGWLLGSGEGLVRGARRARVRPFCILWAGVLGTALLAACTPAGPPETAAGGALGSYVVPPGIHKIKHVIIIMHENRSFD